MKPAPTRPEHTVQITRGVQRLLADLGLVSVTEMALGNGRRADVVGLCPRGQIWIVEVKSGPEDFLTDQKWPDYQPFCDVFHFAVGEGFPAALIPPEIGLIVADGFGGAILRPGVTHPLAGARRKAMTLAFARLAAARLWDARSNRIAADA